MQTKVPTAVATIHASLHGVDDPANPYNGVHTISLVESVIESYCCKAGQHLTFSATPTTGISELGREPGVIVTLANSPFAPFGPGHLEMHALEVAGRLKSRLGQKRVLVILPEDTIQIGDFS